MVLDSAGLPHIVWVQFKGYVPSYARWNGKAWVVQKQFRKDWCEAGSLALDQKDVPTL